MRTISGVPGFSYAGIHSSPYGVYLASKQPDFLPKTRDYEMAIFGMPGLKDFGSDLDYRPLPLNLTMMGSNRQDLIDNILAFAGLFNPIKGYHPLIFDDDPGRYYMAKYTSAVTESQIKFSINRADFPLGFKCDDPFIYSVQEKTVEWESDGESSTSLLNYGTYETPLVITVTADSQISDFTITLNGVDMSFTGTLGDGDVLVIDTGEITYKLNGENAIQYWGGDFPNLQKGTNTLSASESLNLSITYRERWI